MVLGIYIGHMSDNTAHFYFLLNSVQRTFLYGVNKAKPHCTERNAGKLHNDA
ncbi:hypothetical protein AAKU64_000327 [Undibacterium sp. GrIS 1.8]